MSFHFPNPKTTDPKKRPVQRALEMIPGLLTWSTILGMLFFSFFLPFWAAIAVIVFDIYWIHKALYISYFSVLGHHAVNEGKKIDWWERAENSLDPARYIQKLQEKIANLVQEKKTTGLFSLHRRF